MKNCHVKSKDGKDAVITIDFVNMTVTISANIYIYGKGASDDVAKQMQDDIMKAWNKGFSYHDEGTGGDFKVNFDVTVQVFDKDDPQSGPGFFEKHDPTNNDNFIEITDDDKRSEVDAGHLGHWRNHGRHGNSLADDDPATYEFGHILGLKDHYSDNNGAENGWEGNMMAEATPNGKVEQKNIDALLSHIFGSNTKNAFNDYKRRVEANKDNYRWSRTLGLPNIQNSLNPTFNTTINKRTLTW